MRTDLFLKLVGVAKTRMAAKRLCDMGMVLQDGRSLKPSTELEGGETLELLIPAKESRLKVLQIPIGRSVPKKNRSLYAETIKREVIQEDPERSFKKRSL